MAKPCRRIVCLRFGGSHLYRSRPAMCIMCIMFGMNWRSWRDSILVVAVENSTDQRLKHTEFTFRERDIIRKGIAWFDSILPKSSWLRKIKEKTFLWERLVSTKSWNSMMKGLGLNWNYKFEGTLELRTEQRKIIRISSGISPKVVSIVTRPLSQNFRD